MPTQQFRAWRHRRAITTLVIILCAAVVIVGPTQAISEVAGRSLNLLRSLARPRDAQQASKAPSQTPASNSAAPRVAISTGQAAGSLPAVAIESVTAASVLADARATTTTPAANANDQAVAGSGGGNGQSGRSSSGGGQGRSSGSGGASSSGSGGGSGGAGGSASAEPSAAGAEEPLVDPTVEPSSLRLSTPNEALLSHLIDKDNLGADTPGDLGVGSGGEQLTSPWSTTPSGPSGPGSSEIGSGSGAGAARARA